MSKGIQNLNYSWIDPQNKSNNKMLTFAKQIINQLISGNSALIEEQEVISLERQNSSLDLGPSLSFNSGGTSGNKKIIQHSVQSMSESVYGLQDFLQSEVISSWCCLPLHHVGGAMQVIRAQLTDGTVFFFDFRQLLTDSIHQDVSQKWLSLVPTQIYHLVKSPKACKNLRKFKGIFVGGAAITDKLAESCRSEDLPILPSYGMTETAGMVTLMNKESFWRGENGVGRVLSHASLKTSGTENIISVKSKSMAKNLFSSEASSQWLTTPDYGKCDRNGNWSIDGRTDRIIISGGKKVNPEEIEKFLLNSDLMESCYIKGIKDVKWGHRVVAYVTPKSLDTSKLEQYARGKLKPFEVPKQWITLDELPLSEMGKPKA